MQFFKNKAIPISGHFSETRHGKPPGTRNRTQPLFRLWIGVGGGIRTHGHWNHNPALYQLSYTHRGGNASSVTTPEPTRYPRPNWGIGRRFVVLPSSFRNTDSGSLCKTPPSAIS